MKRAGFYFAILILFLAANSSISQISPKQSGSEDEYRITDVPKWSPVYGEKGELLNPEPAIRPGKAVLSEEIAPSILETVLLSEDFEGSWDALVPPTGWSYGSVDGNEGSQFWWTDDWYKYYYSTWSDTVARIYYSSSSEYNYDEWLITPSVDLTMAAICSLVFRNYYDDRSVGQDSAFILGSTDGGTTWAETLACWDSDQPSAYKNIDVSICAGMADVKFAFVLTCSTHVSGDIYAWYIDKVSVWADENQLLFQDFNNWGPGGDNPPAGWTIIDNGLPKEAEPDRNENDWHKYTGWSSGTARVYYASSYREYQDDWLISPSFSISSGVACTLSLAEYYYHSSTSTPFQNFDHGYIKITTDGGSNWDTLYDNSITKGSSSTKNYFKYSLHAYAGQTVQLAFNFINAPGGYDRWMIDDVVVEDYTMLANDVLKVAINSPTMAIEGYDWDVVTTVVNAGSNTETFDDSVIIEEISKTIHFSENFSYPQGWTGANPPINDLGDWSVIDSGSAADGWNNNDWHSYYYSTWSDTVARVYFSPTENQNEWLITPLMDLTGYINLHLEFKTYYDDYDTNDFAYILGTTDGFATIETLDVWTSDIGGSGELATVDYDISSWADSSSSLELAFKYSAYDGLYWYLDDVTIYSLNEYISDYSSYETVTDLASQENREINYSQTWNDPDPADYLVTSYTLLGSDEDRSNDTLTQPVTCYPHYGSGGPDAEYCIWEDNINGTGGSFNWIDISTIGTPVPFDLGSGDDRYTSGIDLGFSFYFYGQFYDSIYISEEGFASFSPLASSNHANSAIPSAGGPENLLALLWDDLNGTSGNAYYYTNNVDTFIVQYDSWKYLSSSLSSTIQMELLVTGADSSIIFQYNEHGPDISLNSTAGIENSSGTAGLQYFYNGAPVGNMPLSGLAIKFSHTTPVHDVALFNISRPYSYEIKNMAFTPRIEIKNYSDSIETFNAYFNVYDTAGVLIYADTDLITDLGARAVDTVEFSPCTISVEGAYTCTTFIDLVEDDNRQNDTLSLVFDVYEHFSEGGPDDYFYRWIDNLGDATILADPPAYNWIDITSDGTMITDWPNGTSSDHRDDGWTDMIDLNMPGGFWFYGETYDSLIICTNGWLSFYQTDNSYVANHAPGIGEGPHTGIFAGWDDQDGRAGGSVYYKYDSSANHFIVSWIDWGYYNDSRNPHDFQVILNGNDSTVIMQFGPIDGEYDPDVTVGLQDSSRSIGLNYFTDNDREGNRPRDSLAIKFYFEPPNADVGVSDILSPPSIVVADESYELVCEVTNYGMLAQSFDVIFEIYIQDSTIAELVDTFPVSNLDGWSVDTITFTKTFVPNMDTVFELISYTDLAGDEDSGNDTTYGNSNSNILANNLVGYWRFNEGSGDTAYDYSGSNNNGVINGAFWTTGLSGSALDFDGSDDEVIISTSSSLDLMNSYTISAWINRQGPGDGTPTHDGEMIVAKEQTHNIRSYELGLRDLKPRTAFFDSDDNAYTVTSTTLIGNDQWYHLAGTYDYDVGLLSIYLDGNLSESLSVGQHTIMQTSIPVIIGAYINVSGSGTRSHFNGLIDEVRLYSRALNEDEITYLYNLNKPEPGFIGGTVTDTSANPIENVEVFIQNTGSMDTTDANGEYIIGDLMPGSYDIMFLHPEYFDTTVTGTEVISNDTTTLNVSMKPIPSTDAGVSAIISPPDSIIVGNNYELIAEVANYGLDAQSFDVIFEIYTLDPLIAELIDTVNIVSMPGQSVDTAVFSDTLIPGLDTIYMLIAYTALAGDANSGNDSVITYIVAYDSPPNDLCENAEFISQPYPASDTGSCYMATQDCGYMNGIWYKFYLPYDSNTVTFVACGLDEDIDWGYAVLYDSCECVGPTSPDDQVQSDSSECFPDYDGYRLKWFNVPGPDTILYLVSFLEDYQSYGVDFLYELNVDETELGLVAGYVTDTSGAPIESVYVEIHEGSEPSASENLSELKEVDNIELASGYYYDSTFTDENGYYEIFMPIGTYYAWYWHKYYQDTTITGIDITHGDTTEVNVALIPKFLHLVSTMPSQNELNVMPEAVISLTFDKPVSFVEIDSANIAVMGKQTGLHSGWFDYDSLNNTISFHHINPFAVGEIVTVMVTDEIRSIYGMHLENSCAWSFTVKAEASAGVFVLDSSYAAGSNPVSIFAADLNEDGYIDLVAANQASDSITVLFNTGTGIFAQGVSYESGDFPNCVSGADFDLDGDIDLIAANSWDHKLRILLNTGNGVFAPDSEYSAGNGISSIAIADYNGDAFCDIATSGHWNNEVHVLLNDKFGMFHYDSLYYSGSLPVCIISADIENDGDFDLIMADSVDMGFTILPNNGNGVFGDTITYFLPDDHSSILAADLNQDGFVDIAITYAANDSLQILMNDSNGSFSLDSSYVVGSLPNDICAADIDGDGDLDLISVNTGSDNISILFNEIGYGLFPLDTSYDVGNEPVSIAAADFNGDGLIDIAIASLLDNNVAILFNQAIRPNTWIVDDDGTPGIDCHCNTIQACIDSAGNGDTVYVIEGDYDEYLWIDKPLYLIGDTTHAVAEIIGEPSWTATISIEIDSGMVEIKNFFLNMAEGQTEDTAIAVIDGDAIIRIENNTILGKIYDYNYSTTSSLHCTNNIIINRGMDAVGIAWQSPNYEIKYNDIIADYPFGYSSPDTLLGIINQTNANGDSCDYYYNIFLDPEFVDTANGDYSLLATSPCIDAGDPALPYDPDGTIADIGAYYYDQAPTNRTWIVDDDGTPGIDCHCNTIQACIDSAANGDTILVKGGVYGELLVIDKGLYILADTSENKPAIIGEPFAEIATIHFALTQADTVWLEGFLIKCPYFESAVDSAISFSEQGDGKYFIRNNTIIGMIQHVGGNQSIDLKNNIIYNQYFGSGISWDNELYSISYNDIFVALVPFAFIYPDTLLGAINYTNINGDSCDFYYNIFLDPEFVDTANGDYSLLPTSPCIDAGDPSSPYDPDGTIADIGAYYYDQTPTNSTWIVDDDGTPGIDCHCTTIQACIDSAGNGDTVYVVDGVYSELLWIDKGTILIGDTTEAVPEIICDEPYGGFTILIQDTIGTTVIEGFLIKSCYESNSDTAIYIEDISEIFIVDNTIIGEIVCYGAQNIHCVNNIIFNPYGYMGIEGVTETSEIRYNDILAIYAISGDPDTLLGVINQTNANGDSCDFYYNIFLDPEFVDTANGDYSLLATSPCIDAGDPALPYDPDGTIADIGAYYYDQATDTLVIGGYVYDTLGNGGYFSEPNDGWPVYLIQDGTTIDSQLTDDFYYQFDSLASGIYEIALMRNYMYKRDSMIVELTTSNNLNADFLFGGYPEFNGNNVNNISDLNYISNYLSNLIPPHPTPAKYGDYNGDGIASSVADMIYLINYLSLAFPLAYNYNDSDLVARAHYMSDPGIPDSILILTNTSQVSAGDTFSIEISFVFDDSLPCFMVPVVIPDGFSLAGEVAFFNDPAWDFLEAREYSNYPETGQNTITIMGQYYTPSDPPDYYPLPPVQEPMLIAEIPVLVDSSANPGYFGFEIGSDSLQGNAVFGERLGLGEWIPQWYGDAVQVMPNEPAICIHTSNLLLSGYVGTTLKDTLMISNAGTADLTLDITTPDWITVSYSIDTLAPTDTALFFIQNAPDLDSAGYYSDTLFISSNDPLNPLVNIPVAMDYIFPPILLNSPTVDDYVAAPVNFAWQPPAGSPIYTLRIGREHSHADTLWIPDLTDTVVSVGGDSLPSGFEYYWQVKAAYGAIEGEWTGWRRFWVIESVPTLIAPADYDTLKQNTMFIWGEVATAGRYNFKITIDDELSNTVYYEQLYQDTFCYFDQLQLLALDSTYYWSVQARLNGIWQPYAEPFAFVYKASSDTLCSPIPQIPGADDSLSFPAIFSWDDTCGSSEYDVYILAEPSFGSDTLWEGLSTIKQMQVPDLGSMPIDSQYYWILQGHDSGGTPSHFSQFVNFFKISSDQPLDPPVIIYPLANDTVLIDTIHFSWNPVDGATHYKLRYSTSPSFPADPYQTWIINNITGAFYDLISPANSGYIYWQVEARNNTYQSGYCSSVGFYYLGGFGGDITSIRIVRPAGGFTGMVGQQLSGHAYFVGSYEGMVEGAWYHSDTVFSQFSRYMDSTGLSLDSPNLPTLSTGNYSLQIQIVDPEPLASNLVLYSIVEPQFTQAKSLSIVARPQSMPADSTVSCTLTVKVLDTQGRHKTDDIPRTINLALYGEGVLDSSVVHGALGSAKATYSPSTTPDTVVIVAYSGTLDSGRVNILTYQDPIAQMVTIGGELIERLDNFELETINGSPSVGGFDVSSHTNFMAYRVDIPSPDVDDTLAFRRMMAADKIYNYAYYYDNSLSFDQSGRRVPGTLGMWNESAYLSRAYTGLVLWAADSGEVIAENLPEPFSLFFASLFDDLRTRLDNKFADMANGITGYAGYALQTMGDDIILKVDNGLISGDSLSELLQDDYVLVSALDVAISEYLDWDQHWLDSVYNWTFVHYFSGDFDENIPDSVIDFNMAKTDLAADQVEDYGAGEMIDVYAEDYSYIPSDALSQSYELLDIAFDVLSNQAFFSSINQLAQTADEIPPSLSQALGLIFNGEAVLAGIEGLSYSLAGKNLTRELPVRERLLRLQTDFSSQSSNYELLVREFISRASAGDSVWLASKLDSLLDASKLLAESFEAARAPLIAAYQEAFQTIPDYDSLYATTDQAISQGWLKGKKFEIAVIELLFDFQNVSKLNNLVLKGNQTISANDLAAQNLQNVLNMLFTTPATPLVTVEQITIPQTIIAGKPETLAVNLINSGSGDAQNVYIQVEPGTGLELNQPMPLSIGDIPSSQTAAGNVRFTVPGSDLSVFKLKGETTCRIKVLSENSQTRSKQLRVPYKADIGRIEFIISDNSVPLEDVAIEVEFSSTLVMSGLSNVSGLWLTGELYPETYQILLQKDGYNPVDTQVTALAGDTITVNLTMEAGGYAYLPGDANMYNGVWPPAVLGSDVTYLINYFRAMETSQPCLLDGFWASADANGDCIVIGSDVTRLINYLRGTGLIDWCADFEPLYPPIPDDPPAGWPNCEVSVTGRIIPGTGIK